MWDFLVEIFPADVPAVNLDSQVSSIQSPPGARSCGKQVEIKVFALSYSICSELDSSNPAKPIFVLCGARLALQSIAFFCAISAL